MLRWFDVRLISGTAKLAKQERQEYVAVERALIFRWKFELDSTMKNRDQRKPLVPGRPQLLSRVVSPAVFCMG